MTKREQLPLYMKAICLNPVDAKKLEELYDQQILVQRKDIKILPIFTIFEFGLVFFGLVALLNINLRSKIIEFLGPFLDAICALTTQIIKKIIEKNLKDEEINSINHTQLDIAVSCVQ